MKNFVLVIVLVCCSCLGVFIKKHYILKKELYKNLYYFTQKLINNISFNNEKLINFVCKEKEDCNLDFKKLLTNYETYLLNKITKAVFLKKLTGQLYFLKQEEVNNISNFLTNIGSKTKEEEIDFLNNNLFIINKKLENAEENYKKYANLYLKLFIVLGAVLFIIFL